MTDLVAGRVDYYFDAFSTVQEHTSAGRIQILGVSTPTRAPQAPEVPTIAEAGLPGFYIAPWWGIIAPAGVPGPVLERLAGPLRQALAQPTVAAALAGQGCTAAFLPPAEFERFVRAEDAKWTRVIEAAGLRVS
jgi:tripartite-type tricarboxylate transporter receptor subunit TctC